MDHLLDRLARSTRHLVGLAAELEALGVDLVVTDRAIDTIDTRGPPALPHARRDRRVRAGPDPRARDRWDPVGARAGPPRRPSGQVPRGAGDGEGALGRRRIPSGGRSAARRPSERRPAGVREGRSLNVAFVRRHDTVPTKSHVLSVLLGRPTCVSGLRARRVRLPPGPPRPTTGPPRCEGDGRCPPPFDPGAGPPSVNAVVLRLDPVYPWRRGGTPGRSDSC